MFLNDEIHGFDNVIGICKHELYGKLSNNFETKNHLISVRSNKIWVGLS